MEAACVERDMDTASGRQRLPVTSSFGREDSVDSRSSGMDMMFEIVVPEESRLHRLKQIQPPYEDEDSEPFLSSVKLVKYVFGVPISLVSLIYDDFQWFKAGEGLMVNQTERCVSFCAHHLNGRHPEVLYVPDAKEDERFCNNYLVTGPPWIRFYASAPIITQDNVRLGALCMIDTQPRSMTSSQMQTLVNIAELTSRELLRTETGKKMVEKMRSGDKEDREQKRFQLRRLPTPSSHANMIRQLREIPNNPYAYMNMIRELWFDSVQEGILVVSIKSLKWWICWANENVQDTGLTPNQQALFWLYFEPVEGTVEEIHHKWQVNSSEEQEAVDKLEIVVRSKMNSKLFALKCYRATKPIAKAVHLIRLPDESQRKTPEHAIPLHSFHYQVLIIKIKPCTDAPQKPQRPQPVDGQALAGKEQRVSCGKDHFNNVLPLSDAAQHIRSILLHAASAREMSPFSRRLTARLLASAYQID